MTTGIYLLTFKKPVWGWYVGKSTNIEKRYLQHLDQLTKGTHARKLQDAYAGTKKPPELKVLVTCHKDWLDILETDLYAGVKSYYNRAKRAPYYTCLNSVTLSEDLILNNKNKHILISDLTKIVCSGRDFSKGLLDITSEKLT